MQYSPCDSISILTKATEEPLTKELKAEASAELANFKMYTDSDLSHMDNDLADYLILKKELFLLIVLSNDRITIATYIIGKQAYDHTLYYDLNIGGDYKFP